MKKTIFLFFIFCTNTAFSMKCANFLSSEGLKTSSFQDLKEELRARGLSLKRFVGEGGVQVETTSPHAVLLEGEVEKQSPHPMFSGLSTKKRFFAPSPVVRTPQPASAFLRHWLQERGQFNIDQQGRRRWSKEAPEKGYSFSASLEALPFSKNIVIRSQTGGIQASGSILYAPYHHIGRKGEQKELIPWTSGDKLLDYINGGLTKNKLGSPHQLPVERFFNMLFERPKSSHSVELTNDKGEVFEISTGFLVELGAYAIKPDAESKEEVTRALYYEFLMSLFDRPFKIHAEDLGPNLQSLVEDENFQSPIYFTYGESVGRRLYRWGFDPLEEVKREAYGVIWNPLIGDRRTMARKLKAAKLEEIATRVFNDAFSKRGLEPRTGQPNGGQSLSQELRAGLDTESYIKSFFKLEERIRSEVFFNVLNTDEDK